jgi:hypothetical protein
MRLRGIPGTLAGKGLSAYVYDGLPLSRTQICPTSRLGGFLWRQSHERKQGRILHANALPYSLFHRALRFAVVAVRLVPVLFRVKGAVVD